MRGLKFVFHKGESNVTIYYRRQIESNSPEVHSISKNKNKTGANKIQPEKMEKIH